MSIFLISSLMLHGVASNKVHILSPDLWICYEKPKLKHMPSHFLTLSFGRCSTFNLESSSHKLLHGIFLISGLLPEYFILKASPWPSSSSSIHKSLYHCSIFFIALIHAKVILFITTWVYWLSCFFPPHSQHASPIPIHGLQECKSSLNSYKFSLPPCSAPETVLRLDGAFTVCWLVDLRLCF